MDLKKYFDAANAAEARVQTIAAQIDGHFEAGKVDEATALKPQLDAAQADAKKAHELYISMLNASSGGIDPAQRIMPSGRVEVITAEEDQPFEKPGHFFQAVKMAALRPSQTDRRLLRFKDATGLSEGVPADGGYLVIPEYSKAILDRVYSIGQILSRISLDSVSGNSMVYNALDESSRAAGSRLGGVTTYWVNEGGSITSSKPKFRQLELKVKKCAALCYATDEQLEDTAALESWLTRVVPDELRFSVEDAVINGTGVGQPLGILNSGALLSLLRVDASEVDATDIANMWAHRFPGYTDYVWLIDPGVFPQLVNMVVGNFPVMMQGNVITGQPAQTIYGRPVIETEHNQALGTAGDIMLASLSQYQAIDKGGVKSASSIHVAFTTDEMAFRFIYRFDGEPIWNTTLTTTSATSCSPFVVLGASS